MATIPVGFSECTFVFRCQGIDRDVTWALGMDDASFSTTDPEEQAVAMYGYWSATSRPYAPAQMTTQWSFLGTSVTMMKEEGPLTGQAFATIVGTKTGAPVPVNCAYLARKNTTLGGRRNRGRAYLPPLFGDETTVDQAGEITSATVNSINTLINSAFAAMIAGGISAVLFHTEAPFTPTPVTGMSVQTTLATQRRRMRS